MSVPAKQPRPIKQARADAVEQYIGAHGGRILLTRHHIRVLNARGLTPDAIESAVDLLHRAGRCRVAAQDGFVVVTVTRSIR